jgi:hypothetical protein
MQDELAEGKLASSLGTLGQNANRMQGRVTDGCRPCRRRVHVLRRGPPRPRSEARFLQGIGEFDTECPVRDDWPRIAELVETYADLPLGGTDAFVIALAERCQAPGSWPSQPSYVTATTWSRARASPVGLGGHSGGEAQSGPSAKEGEGRWPSTSTAVNYVH